MSRPDSNAAEEAFFSYLELASQGQVESFDAFCREHADLAEALEHIHASWLLLEGERARRTQDGEPGTASPQVDERLRRLGKVAPRFERYVPIVKIADGGMGSVTRVWDEDLRRVVAMKVTPLPVAAAAGAAGEHSSTIRRVIARFIEEAQVTGQLDHPGVVPVHDVGLDRQGHVFFTMRLVEGRDLGSVFELTRRTEEGWTQARALNVLIKVCETIAYAHEKGVVHRDLKPSNVMVGRFGEVYVMDWGLARLLARDEEATRSAHSLVANSTWVESDRAADRATNPASSLSTLDGAIVGTPAYMPPEQANGQLAGIKGDIYAIGALLYHLLTGHRPYGDDREESTSSERILTALRRGPPTPIDQRDPAVAPELCAICEKAMARDPEQRYGDCMAIASDLTAFLENRVVRAHRTGALVEARKWVSRNRVVAALCGIVLVLLSVGPVITLFVQRMAQRHLEAERSNTEFESYVASIAATTAALRLHDVAEASMRLTRAPQSRRNFEWFHLESRLDQSDRTLRGHERWVHRVRFSPDGKLLVSASADTTLCMWDATTGELWHQLRGHTRDVTDVRFFPDGERLASVSGDGTLKFWSTADGTLLDSWEISAKPLATVAIDPTGTCIATGGDDATVRVFETATRREIHALAIDTGSVLVAAFSPDGLALAIGTAAGELILFDVANGVRKWSHRFARKVQSVAFRPDGKQLIAGDGRARLIDVASGNVQATWGGEDSHEIEFATYAADGRRIAGLSPDTCLRIWDRERESLVAELRGHREPVVFVDWHPSGTLLASACYDGTVKIWDAAITGDVLTLPKAEGYAYSVCFDRVGERLAWSAHDQIVRLVDARSGLPLASHFVPSVPFSIAFSHDGSLLAAALHDHHVLIFAASDGTALCSLDHAAPVRAVVFSSCGRWLASGDAEGHVKLWRTSDWQEMASLEAAPASDGALAFDPTGNLLAMPARDHAVEIVMAQGGHCQRRLTGHGGEILSVAWSADGTTLASASADRTIRLWNAAQGELRAELRGHAREVEAVAFSPDGSRLVSGARDRLLLLWDVASAREVARLAGHRWWVHAVAFSADGKRIASAGKDGLTKIWSAEPVGVTIARARLERDREARVASTTAALFDEVVFTRDVVTRVLARAAWSEAERHTAVRLARVTGDDPRRLERHFWPRLAHGEGDPQSLRAWLAIARAADSMDSGMVPLHQVVMAAAHFRLGEHSQSGAILRSLVARKELAEPERSCAIALSAMVHWQRGETELANADLARLDSTLKTTGTMDQATTWLTKEARDLGVR